MGKSMKLEIFNLATILLLLMGWFSGCHKEDATILEGNCIIKHMPPPDNCNDYMIIFEKDVPENNILYKPDKLSEEFKVDNLHIKLTYRITEDKYNCSFGGYVPVINIIKIQKQ